MNGTIFLTGFMGTGKTTVGELLARRLGVSFIDLDELISRDAGATIPDIFEHQGEPAFRDMEAAMLSRVAMGMPGAVVATGGGAVLRDENRRLMARTGVVVNLTASQEAIAVRVAGDTGRPLLGGEEIVEKIARLFVERELLYRECHAQIDTTGKTPDEIVGEILVWLKSSLVRCGESDER